MLLARLAAFALSLVVTLGAAEELKVYVTTPGGRPAPDTVVMVLPKPGIAPTPLADPPLIVQQDIRFEPYVTAVPLGSTIRFVNRDRYDHHVRSQPGGPLGSIAPAKAFEFRIAAAGFLSEPQVDLKMDTPGAITIGCHLHGSMRAHIFVSPSPWIAVTDAAGLAVVRGVPAGTADLRIWHPDQLSAQPDVRVEVAGTTSAETRLNFTPRRRPPPRAKGEYEN